MIPERFPQLKTTANNKNDKKEDGEKMTPEEREALEREAKATAKKEEFQRQNNNPYFVP